jgi:hypothetical protein
MNKIAEKITTVLCDDIRREVGNKDSLMGVYQDIVIESVPTLLQRFSLMAYLYRVKTEINKVLVTLSIPGSEPKSMIMTPPQKDKKENSAKIAISVGPIEITQPGIGKWEIFINGSKSPQATHKFKIKLIALS